MKPSGIVVLSHSINVPIEAHRSREFIDRMKCFAEVFGSVHIVSLNSKVNSYNIRASETHKIFITHLRTWSIKGQVILAHLLLQSQLVFSDTQSDFFNNILAIYASHSRPILFMQGFVIDQFLLSSERSYIGKLLSPLFRILTFFLEFLLFRMVARVITVSKSMTTHIRKFSKSLPIHYIPPSLSYTERAIISDCPKEIRELSEKGFILISYIGRLAKSKRVHIAIKAAAQLIKRGHKIKLVIVGDGKELYSLKLLSKDLNIESNVIFTGHVSRAIALSILRVSKVMLFPSESEGFSWSVLESLALGCPVVSSKYKSSMEDGLGSIISLIESSNPIDYTNQVERLIVDDEFYLESVQKGIAFSKQFTERTPEQRNNEFIQIMMHDFLK